MLDGHIAVVHKGVTDMCPATLSLRTALLLVAQPPSAVLHAAIPRPGFATAEPGYAQAKPGRPCDTNRENVAPRTETRAEASEPVRKPYGSPRKPDETRPKRARNCPNWSQLDRLSRTHRLPQVTYNTGVISDQCHPNGVRPNAVNYLGHFRASRVRKALELQCFRAKAIPSPGAHGKKYTKALFSSVFCTIKAELVYGVACDPHPRPRGACKWKVWEE